MKNAFRRKNEIFYCISTKEISIDVKDVSGKVYLPLLTKDEINQRLSKIPSEVRKKISMVHLGAIQILIKAQFRNGINSPIKMALVDNQINDVTDSISKNTLPFNQFSDEISQLLNKGEKEEMRPVHPYDELDELHKDIDTLVDLVTKQ